MPEVLDVYRPTEKISRCIKFRHKSVGHPLETTRKMATITVEDLHRFDYVLQVITLYQLLWLLTPLSFHILF